MSRKVSRKGGARKRAAVPRVPAGAGARSGGGDATEALMLAAEAANGSAKAQFALYERYNAIAAAVARTPSKARVARAAAGRWLAKAAGAVVHDNEAEQRRDEDIDPTWRWAYVQRLYDEDDGDSERALAVATKVFDYLQKHARDIGTWEALMVLSYYYVRGRGLVVDTARARAILDEAMQMAESDGNQGWIACTALECLRVAVWHDYDYAAARAAFDKIDPVHLKNKETNMQDYRLLSGRLHQSEGDSEAAIRFYLEAAKHDAADGFVHAQLARLLPLDACAPYVHKGLDWTEGEENTEDLRRELEYRYAVVLEKGYGKVKKDANIALYYMLQAAEAKHPAACMHMYERTDAERTDEQIKWLLFAAHSDSAEAHYLLYTKLSIDKPRDALDHLRSAARLGYTRAYGALARVCYDGLLNERRDIEQAREYIDCVPEADVDADTASLRRRIYFALCESLYDRGDVAQCRRVIDAHVERHRADRPYFALFFARFAEAEDDFGAALGHYKQYEQLLNSEAQKDECRIKDVETSIARVVAQYTKQQVKRDLEKILARDGVTPDEVVDILGVMLLDNKTSSSNGSSTGTISKKRIRDDDDNGGKAGASGAHTTTNTSNEKKQKVPSVASTTSKPTIDGRGSGSGSGGGGGGSGGGGGGGGGSKLPLFSPTVFPNTALLTGVGSAAAASSGRAGAASASAAAAAAAAAAAE